MYYELRLAIECLYFNYYIRYILHESPRIAMDIMTIWFFIAILDSISATEEMYFAAALHPSRRRSLFTLATYMIIFSSKVYDVLPLVSLVKAALTDETVGAKVYFRICLFGLFCSMCHSWISILCFSCVKFTLFSILFAYAFDFFKYRQMCVI